MQTHYCPEEKLQKLISEGSRDSLEAKAVDLVYNLADATGIAPAHFGVTGSILIDLHIPKTSDVDLTISGRVNSLKVKSTLISLYTLKSGELQSFSRSQMEEWCRSKVKLYGITLTHARELYRRIWNRGIYRGTMFSVHPIRLNREVKERYGDKAFQAEEMAEIETTVKGIEESLFMPCLYRVEDTTSSSGSKLEDVKEIVSYEGLYGGIFNEGERVVVRGLIETVTDRRRDNVYRRSLVGSRRVGGRDYIKPKGV